MRKYRGWIIALGIVLVFGLLAGWTSQQWVNALWGWILMVTGFALGVDAVEGES